jgi:hypothetical protein
MFRSAIATAILLAMPATAIAQDKQAETGQPPKRIRSVTITSNEKCPQSSSDEIVVCTTVQDPYRIPKELRGAGPIPPSRQSWVNRVAADEETSREAAGLPNTCSPVGSGGATGCSQAAARAWAAERRAKANGQSDQ